MLIIIKFIYIYRVAKKPGILKKSKIWEILKKICENTKSWKILELKELLHV